MFRFLTSLTFLYALAITVLLIYGLVYYRDFARSGYQRKRFPFIFLLVFAACFSFLWINMHAPLQLKTYSNLDHYFIRHEGFEVAKSIELGKLDTSNNPDNSFNRFRLEKENNQVSVSSPYSEDPFYILSSGNYHILSAVYPATGHTIAFRSDSTAVKINVSGDSSFVLFIADEAVARTGKMIRKGTSAWNIFKDDISFINTEWYTNERMINCLRNIYLLQSTIPANNSQARNTRGQPAFFLSGRLFQWASLVQYDDKKLKVSDGVFKNNIPDQSTISWGLASPDNNRNQFRIKNLGNDSFALINPYPVSYPLTEEKKEDNHDEWQPHAVNKFLVSDSRDIKDMPSVFPEGFLFNSFNGDSSMGFSPVLLSYRKENANDPVALQARFMDNPKMSVSWKHDRLVLPAKSTGISWVFSVNNTFNWNFGNRSLSADGWQWIMFGALGFFFIMVFVSAWLHPADKLSWVWQILSCVSMVLLTTRFFLYWRYKSFPPYEGLDLPSLQQLSSFWNFGVIIFTGLAMGIIFGFGALKYISSRIMGRVRSLFSRNARSSGKIHPAIADQLNAAFAANRFVKRVGAKGIFFASWALLLIAGAGFASMNNFDPGICRHLAIGLTILYFIYIFISYRHSPLVASAEKSWWRLNTGSALDILVNNPVKVLLTISMLGIFGFIDIGFAIVFLNFLLFNEAFLCINYAIAGLSAGSKKNARLFGILGAVYLCLFVLNLLYAPAIFKFLMDMPQLLYVAGYGLAAVVIAYHVIRLIPHFTMRKKAVAAASTGLLLFTGAFLFFPKEKILEKAAITKYRIDVMTMPVEQAIETAYDEGQTYEPVIRAAQNQWFINTFIYEKNNPGVNSVGFHLLPHAPQNKGAKYNAQATDLVASRFFIAEHGKWSALLYVLLLILPATLLASFYKLYPDFTNRINTNYPTITAGFSVLNYLLITALLVILAATGRYIFFGQDLPFGSILSKQSVLFPTLLIIAVVLLFKKIPLERYPNRKKLIPGAMVFVGLALLLFFVKPAFNKNKEFTVADLSKDMDAFIQMRLQPALDYIDTAKATKRLSLAAKDQLFTDSVRTMINEGAMLETSKFFAKEIEQYTRSGFSRHLDQARLLYLDLNSGTPQLAVNDNYFRIEPPPHLQQYWTGNLYGDTTAYNIALWNEKDGSVVRKRLTAYTNTPAVALTGDWQLVFRSPVAENEFEKLYLINHTGSSMQVKYGAVDKSLGNGDSIRLQNPYRINITDPATGQEKILMVEPDAFMKNYYVNGSRFYVYPMGRDFIWARNFAESVSTEYTNAGQPAKNAAVSFDRELMDSLSVKIKGSIGKDTAYKKGAEYGICVADGNGRIVAMSDFIKGMNRPDPNDKTVFARTIQRENGFISQSLLRKQIGNINLLRLNPGPGSTLKPIVFSAIASQLDLDWDQFSSTGFSEKQQYYGGEKVAEYDFEKNNGRISSVKDYLRLSDNYYYSNVLLLGSYQKQDLQGLLGKNFVTSNPDGQLHWPYFGYKDKQYWLNGFKNWPGYFDGKANFGSDSSFVSVGLNNNYGVYTKSAEKSFDQFSSGYDSSLFMNAARKSGFLLPEYGLFDQQGAHIDHRIPYDLFTACFRGHVKGSSQVMIPPVKMVDAFGKLFSQSRNYALTLNPYAKPAPFAPFNVDNKIVYNNYLSLIRESVFEGMKQALFGGTAARLGTFLKNGAPYFYYAKTGTTGDDEVQSKSKLFAIVISAKDMTAPGFNFRNNKFYTIYFTSQNGAPKQNEELQAAVIKYIEQSPAFLRYMNEKH